MTSSKGMSGGQENVKIGEEDIWEQLQVFEWTLEGESAFNHVGQAGLKLLTSNLVLPSRLEYSEAVIAHCSLDLLGSNDPPTSAFQSAGITVVNRFPRTENGIKISCNLVNMFDPSIWLRAEQLFRRQSLALWPGWNALARSRPTATSVFRFQAILLPQLHEWSLTPLPRLECSGMISAHCSPRLLGSNDSLASVF
ncbi:hypothetical protein AAY473_030836 [Plecturocebus cupreus]